jgi:hypothetical protein
VSARSEGATMPKLCVLADTLTYHDFIHVPRAALTVHAGNFTRKGTIDECIAFLGWFGALPGMKVLVAGKRDDAKQGATNGPAWALCS